MTSHPPVETPDGVSLHVADCGDGTPVLFLHEFAGDHRSWSGQVDGLSDDRRCITYAARGYPPSGVPTSPSAYSWGRAVTDAIAVLDALAIEAAHMVGCSMGGYTALQLGIHHPTRVRSITAVSVGSGSDPTTRAAYLAETEAVARALRTDGPAHVGRQMAGGPTRIQLRRRDEAAWHRMVAQFGELSPEGLALTILGVQGQRPSLHDMADSLGALTIPLLVVVGDEDEACLSTGLMLKRTVPTCGLHVIPHTGHVPNLEDPARFNETIRRFLRHAEDGTWPARDPRSLRTLQFDLAEAETVAP